MNPSFEEIIKINFEKKKTAYLPKLKNWESKALSIKLEIILLKAENGPLRTEKRTIMLINTYF